MGGVGIPGPCPPLEMPLHAMAKAAAFLVLDIFEKGLEPPLWNSVWQLLFAGDLFFFSCWLSRFTKNSFWHL